MTDAFSPDEQSAIIKEFLDESAEHIENLNRSLLISEDHVKKNSAVPDEHINEMFRAVHTVKGSASFLGFVKVHTLAHHMETLMDKVRRGKIELDTHVIDTLFKGFDGLERLISSLEGGAEEDLDIDQYLEAFDEAGDKATSAGKSAAAKETPQKETEPKKAKKTEPKKAAPKKAAPKKAAPKKTTAKKTEKNEDSAGEDKKPRIKIDRSKYLNDFIEDAKQHVDEFNSKLLQLEKKNDDEAVLQELFRIAHTIKGAAGTMGFAPIEQVVHKAESIFDRLRNENLALSENIFSALFEAVDVVDAMVKELRIPDGSLDTIDTTDVLDSMDVILNDTAAVVKKSDIEEKELDMSTEDIIKFLSEDPNVKEPLKEAVADSKNVFYSVIFCMQKDLPLKDIKFLLIKEKLASVGAVVKADPDPEATHEDDSVFLNSHLVVATTIGRRQLEDAADFDGIDKVKITELDNAAMKQVCEALGVEANLEGSPEAAAVPATGGESTKNVATPGKAAPAEVKKVAIGGATVRIDIQKLDKLMNLAGELVILKAQLNQMVNKINVNFQAGRGLNGKVDSLFKGINYLLKEVNSLKKKQQDNADYEKIRAHIDSLLKDEDSILSTVRSDRLSMDIADLGETTSKLSKISSDIQNGVMDTRMVPIEGVFTRFRRLVRDIAKSLDKEISLIIIGEDTELDKKIIDDLGDPLTHMVRNAVDHGIEPRDERAKAGKPEKGTIILKAFHEGNRICIEISDDGKGLDKDAIAKKAVDRGLVSAEAISDLSDSEKFEFIFMPGFSTAQQVTELSGRGVGLDVVRKMIENINGTVDIKSDVGQGTTFVLKIPLTLAIIPALLVIIGGKPYALPLESVVEIIKVKDNEFYSIDGNDTVKLRDHALSIIKLEEVIGMSRTEEKKTDSQKVVVITDGVEQIGVSVDELVGEEEIVIKSLSEHFANVIGIAGASVLGDGRIALILDPLSVMKEAKTGVM